VGVFDGEDGREGGCRGAVRRGEGLVGRGGVRGEKDIHSIGSKLQETRNNSEVAKRVKRGSQQEFV
jgi:hypothetical protein